MPPQPVTPSPHRFVIQRSSRQTPTQQSPGAPHHFNTTPRFSFAASSQTLPPSSTPHLTHNGRLARQITGPPDLIEDVLDESQIDIHQSVEVDGPYADSISHIEKEDGLNTDSRQHKRRRLSSTAADVSRNLDKVDGHEDDYHHDMNVATHNSHGDFEDSVPFSSDTILSSPVNAQPQQPPSSVISSRFILTSTPAPIPPSPSLPTSSSAPFLKPPRFRPPDEQSHKKEIDPLPHAFSPHRRGQKYMTGGLAAEVIGWLVNIENNSSEYIDKQTLGDMWPIEILVSDVNGGNQAGMTLLQGRQVHARLNGQDSCVVGNLEFVRIALAGSGIGNGIEKGAQVERGKIVGIRPPTWEVVIEGERWGVAVDWKVIMRTVYRNL